jgi:hypothetical protein
MMKKWAPLAERKLTRKGLCIRVARWFVFKPKITIWKKLWRALDWKMFTYFMAIWNILWRLGIFYDHLVHFVCIRYIFSGFGSMHREKSGNPSLHESLIENAKLAKLSLISRVRQRCQIFHPTKYQNGEKYTKPPLNYQTAVKYTKWP